MASLLLYSSRHVHLQFTLPLLSKNLINRHNPGSQWIADVDVLSTDRKFRHHHGIVDRSDDLIGTYLKSAFCLDGDWRLELPAFVLYM